MRVQEHHCYFFEDELLIKMYRSFMARFSLDQNTAAELAIEILEMFKVSDSNMYELKQVYLN